MSRGPFWQRLALILRQPWSIPLGLFLLPLLVFGAESLGHAVFFYHDVQYYFFPYHQLAADILRSGQLPLWNPYAFSGIPLLGDGQTALFYPPNWLFLILPTAQALNLSIVLQFSIAGVSMWAFVRSLGLRRGPALIAALAFMWSGFLTGRVVHLSIMSGAALIPLVFWGIERLIQQPSWRRWAIAAGCVAIQAVAGHPQIPVYTAFAAGVYVTTQAAIRAWQQRSVRPATEIARLASVYVAGYALAAIQLVPWFEFASFSPRAAGAAYAFVTDQSFGPADWWLWLFPYGFGGIRQSIFWQPGPDLVRAIYVWERAVYIGITPLILALIGVWGLIIPARDHATPDSISCRPLWALVAVFVVTVLIAAGRYTPFGPIVYAVPVMGKLRAYARAIALAAFVACTLAGWGSQWLLSLPATRRATATRAIGSVAGLLLIIAGAAMLLAPSLAARSAAQPSLWQNLQIHPLAAWLPIIWLLLSAGALLGIRRPLGLGAVVLLTAADLILFARSFNPTSTPQAFAGTPASVQFLQRDPSLYRTASFVSTDNLAPPLAQAQLALSWSMSYGISNINGFNSLQPRRYTDLLFGPEIGDVSYGFLNDQRLLDPDHHLLSLLDVKYVLLQPQSTVRPGPTFDQVYQDADVTIYRNRRVYGRAFFVNSVQPVSASQALSSLRSNAINPRSTALVEDIDPDLARDLAGAVGTPAITTTQTTPNDLVITTSSTYRRFLVISEPWFPGWEARIDGQPVPIYRTDYILRGVVVPAGQHTITLHYRPRSAQIGATTSAIMLVVLGGLSLGRRRRNVSLIAHSSP